jgi:hypothetical protein
MTQPQTPTNQTAADDDDDWMDGASSTFPKMENLAPCVSGSFGPGRLVAIWAVSNGERKNDEGKVYPYVETVTLVLDDGPDGNMFDDLIGVAPVRLEGFQHSTGGLVARLSKRVNGVGVNGVKLRYRPIVGRINTQASKINKHVAAFSISEPTDQDMAVAREYKAMIIGINKELEERDRAEDDANAFG